ncbi:LOB domain-containing protein 36-like isoform X1 [Fagus crenata]
MSSSYSPCAACKQQRRKCTKECVFAPYFPPDQPQKFANVHNVFGASNVAKLLNELNPAEREDAVNSLAFEAQSRLRDPLYGPVGIISYLQHNVRDMQTAVYNAKKELAKYIGPDAMLPIFHSPSLIPQQQQMNNPSSSATVSPYNMSSSVLEIPTAIEMYRGQLPINQYEAQQLGLAREQQDRYRVQQLALAREHQQQPHPHQMFNSGFDQTVVGSVTTSGNNQINQMNAPISVAGMSPSLALGTFESQQAENQLQEQLFLQPQQDSKPAKRL